jgi:hypothetical protein
VSSVISADSSSNSSVSGNLVFEVFRGAVNVNLWIKQISFYPDKVAGTTFNLANPVRVPSTTIMAVEGCGEVRRLYEADAIYELWGKPIGERS